MSPLPARRGAHGTRGGTSPELTPARMQRRQRSGCVTSAMDGIGCTIATDPVTTAGEREIEPDQRRSGDRPHLSPLRGRLGAGGPHRGGQARC